MDYNDIMDYIASQKKFGMKPGLDRMRALTEDIGGLDGQCRFFHIAGTNGKGSVSAYIYNILLAAGIKAGLFISPYILDFRERIQIGGEMISKELLERAFCMIKPAADRLCAAGDPPTEFELTTALAFAAYAESGVRAAVLETGLGGRLDSTNIIKSPLCSVITPVSYDHTAVLGDTIEQIASEKCGIIKQGCPTVLAPQRYGEAVSVCRRVCAERSSALTEVDGGNAEIISESIHGTDVMYGGGKIHIPLVGRHQVQNALTAISAVRAQGCFDIDMQSIAAGISATRFPARFEVICSDPPVILDGAHNPAAFETLAACAKRLFTDGFDVIIGMTAEKDYRACAKIIAPLCGNITVTAAQDSRTPPLAPEALAEELRRYNPNVYAAHSQQEAVAAALKNGGRAVLVCGSLYLASEMRPLLIKAAKER